MASQQNSMLAKLLVGEMTNWQMASWQNGKSVKWQVTKRQVDKISRQQNFTLEKWQLGEIASCQNVKLVKMVNW